MPASPQAVRHAIGLSLLMVLLASTAVAATKYASEQASTAAIVTVQYLICSVLCLPRIRRAGLRELATDHLALHLFRGVAGVLGFYLFYASIENIPMVDAMLLRQSAPLLVPLVLWLWLGEKVPPQAWLPLGIGFVGIAVILRPSPSGLSWWHAAGLASAATLAISMVATRLLASTEPTYRILFYYCVLSLACVAPFSIGDYANISLPGWAAMIYIGIAIYWTLELYTRAYGMAPTAIIAPINYFAVVLAGFWGWVFWAQVPDLWSLLGSLLVISGGLLTLGLARHSARRE
ncbi:MAG: DMT family transporter [Gammaproteobacteria bacterium]|nr:DMT family transporter [Gammaproteobacteria bacterium]